MLKFLKKIWRDERGQALSEYGLLVGLIAVAAIAAIIALRDQLVAIFNALATALQIAP